MNLTQLLREAQFHGSNRLADRRHRSWWALALFMSLLTAAGVITHSVFRYFENPTYLTLLPEEFNQPFPTVQIYPEVLFPDYKIEKFLSEINLPSGTNVSYVKENIRQLAAFYSPDITYKTKDLVMLQSILDYNKLDVENATARMTPSCEETIIRCRWRGDMINCSEIFQFHLSRVGYCCVFNGRSLKREIKEYGVHRIKPNSHIFMKEVGHTSGLMIVVNQSQEKTDVDLSYKWIALETGQDYVDSAKNGTALPPGGEVWVGFGFERFRIADEARGLSADLRRCRFYDEPLKYFPVYKKRYCLIECEMERILRRCHCVLAVHPRPPGAERCRATSLLCAKHATVTYGTDLCDCPATCDTDLDFFFTQYFHLLNETFCFDRFYRDLNFKNVTVVRVFVLNQRSRVAARHSFYSYINLYSQLGGILNLYFGCSILTVLELIQLLWRGSFKRSAKDKVKVTDSKGLILPPVANKRKFKKNNRIE